MIRLAAHFITEDVRAWLHNTHHARILHIFDRACNVIAADGVTGGCVVSLVTPAIGYGPFNVVVPAITFRLHLAPADPVQVNPNRLCIGALDIDLSSAAVWNAYPDWQHLRSQRDHVLAQSPLIQTLLRDHAPTNSLAHLVVVLPLPQSPIEVQMLQVARQHWRVMLRGIQTRDQAACNSGAAGLAGLGSGLTPAGDDWLLGNALAAQIGFPSLQAAEMIQRAVDSAASRTHVLSANWLQSAVRGACSQHWHDFFEQADQGKIAHAARHIIQQGHSSGADALAGYLAVLQAASQGMIT
jgi:hypothetical protein